MNPFTRPVVALCFVLTIVSCSILKNGDQEKEIRAFLFELQADLNKSDEVILTKFQVKQSKEAVLSVISILQNKDPFIVCEAAIANAMITFEKDIVRVEIPTTFHVKELDSKDTESFTLVMWLIPSNDSFQITKLDGEEFFQTFSKIKNSNAWEAERKLAFKERLWIYENARELEAKFDSVIWYSTYGEKNYFYVVDGNWNNSFLDYNTRHLKNTNGRMGLADAKGDIIIPLEYELIGTIGFEKENLVEVTKDGKVGYFNIETKQLVLEPIFDVIIPYGRENAWAIAKSDSLYGWVDNQFNYSLGFTSKSMEEWVNNFEFLNQNISLKPGRYYFCEIPSPEFAGNGIIMPPSYFSKYGIFDEIEGGISTTKVPINGWTDYKETTRSLLQNVTDNIRAVVTTMRERYLEGREEFYNSSKLIFINEKLDTLNVATVSGEDVSMHPVDSTMIEVRTPHDYWFAENDACDENNLYKHSYFAITASKGVTPLDSKRLFPQTQFVKLDSTYLTGNFMVYNYTTEQEEQRTFLSIKTVTYMRDEILASYGYTFPNKERDTIFSYLRQETDPRYATIDEFESQMTDTDRQNISFLNRILEILQPPA